MPKTLSKTDPSLVASVARLNRVQQVWGVLLIGLGIVTEFAGRGSHPVAGLPFIAVGALTLLWRDPALLGAIAALMAFSIVPTINPRITVLGPDPVAVFATLSFLEVAALVAGKALIVLTVSNQFLLYRFLYGTRTATSPDPELALIPEMVPNHTDVLARSARLIGYIGAGLGVVALALSFLDRAAYLPLILSEMAGSLAVIAVGVGFGTAFSPTNERRAALLALATGFIGYALCAATLLRLV